MKNKTLYFSLFLLFLIFGYIEYINPYHFLRNDNLFQFFPNIIHSFETLFSGQMPWINQHQSLGVPMFEMGYYPVLYPLLIISYLLTKLFNNPYLLFEIFTFIHLFVSFILTYLFTKKVIKNELLSSVASFSFIFSGYIMIKLHDWFFLAPTLILLPLIFLFHKKIESKNDSKKLFIWLGILRGIFFYSGHIQFLVYTFFFEFIYLILKFNSKKYDLKKIINYKLSLIISILIGLPNLILMFLMSINSSRQPSLAGYFLSDFVNPIKFILGNIIPSSLINLQNLGFYFVNTILFFGFILFLFKKIRKQKLNVFNNNPYLTLALISMILSFGLFGGLYILFAIIPIWNNFIHPQKLLIFTNFFIVLIGAKYFSKIKCQKLHLGIFILTILFIFIQIPNYSKTNDLTRNQIPFETTNFESEGRILTLLNNSNPYDIKYLGQNYATFFGLYHVTGYDHLMPKASRHISPINRQGQNLFNHHELDKTVLSQYSVKYIITDYKIKNFDLVVSQDNYFVYKNDNFKPFLFEAKSYKKIEFNNNPNGISFESNFDKDTFLVYTNLYHDSYNLYLDGKQSKLTQDEFGRINFIIPTGKHTIELKYERPIFFYSIIVSLILLIILLKFWKPLFKIIKYLFEKFIFPILDLLSMLFSNYLLLTIIIIGLIYSGSFYFTLHKQDFLEPILICKENYNEFVNCVSNEFDNAKLNNICKFYKNNEIKYNLFEQTNSICN
jgi:hypothetical protein